MTPLRAAAANGHEEVALYLLERGADGDEWALNEARVRKLPRLIRALEAKGIR